VNDLQPALSEVELFTREHDTSAFDCGRHASLTLWLRRLALMNQKSGDTRTYVVHRAMRVVAYYSLAPSSIAKASATTRASHSAPDPIPVVLLARLAVDQGEQRTGLGAALLKDSLQRALAGAEIIGGRAVLVHAIDADAMSFYRKYGFEPCPASEFHLMLLMKDIKASLGI
jgi:GNAT superfamily N-acetyltransferase